MRLVRRRLPRSAVASVAAGAAALLAAAPLGAQISSTPHASFTGSIGYVVTGASLRPNSDQANPCAMTSQGTATLGGIPTGATILSAWVYWAGSGPPDNVVRFRGSDIVATRTWP
ncbi:MAG TPA: hypothetical protein VEA99_09635, partial [Gemmatimonadaceae bacterium]|nr:hypothetical protein [Gemmatimonadaceae bacterium]